MFIFKLQGLYQNRSLEIDSIINVDLKIQITTLSIVIEVMNVSYQTSQAFVISSCSFFDCSSKNVKVYEFK